MGKPSWSFAGHTALVTGAGRGIGRAVGARLLDAGAAVHGFDREAPGEAPFPITAVDVADARAVARAVAALDPAPDLLVNNAGITRDRTLAKMSGDEWRAVIDVNLSGAFHVLQAVAAGMAQRGYGRIVNVSSINGLRGGFGQANYAASKAGVIGLTKAAARELGRKGIAVNAIAPGLVLTEMTLALTEERRQQAIDSGCLPFAAEPDDVADAALFLLCDAARAITGVVLQVDCGQYL